MPVLNTVVGYYVLNSFRLLEMLMGMRVEIGAEVKEIIKKLRQLESACILV